MRFLRRPPASSGVAAGERIGGLLPRSGGWVPPEEEPDGAPVEDEVWDEVEGASWSPPPADAQRSWESSPAREPVGPEPPTPERGSPRGSLLPVSVRTGRFDPGRRGAAALVAVTVLAALLAGTVVLRGRPEQVVVPEVVDRGRAAASPGATPGAAPGATSELVVAVAGQVARPGVVRLPPGSRVADAVEAAGGVAPGGSPGLLNLARKLVDGEQVLVGVDPPPGAAGQAGAATRPSASGLLDLNTATASDLDALPGIGPVLAQRIVDWRTDNDRFGSVEQLREVTGIGEAKFQDLKAKVTV
ncbi:MAG: hypothetical protein JWN88_1464 [Frankiales bacterium]|nr:hypothetical protein [Frankiales bacterium]